MKIKYEVDFKGYISIPRGIFLLIKSKKITFAQLGAYLLLISQADWDKRHKNYKVILRDDKEIAEKINCDPSTIHKVRKQLIKKGLLFEIDKKTIVPNLALYQSKSKTLSKLSLEDLQNLIENPQDSNERIQNSVEITQQKQLQNNPQSFNISYNDKLGLSDDDKEYINNSLETEEN